MRLEQYLSGLELDMRKFARHAGVTEGTIRNIVTGRKNVNLLTALKIEKATMGVVKCQDLIPEGFDLDNK